MGTWGPGLYDSDEACELKSEISLLLKLPFPFEDIVSIAGGDLNAPTHNHDIEFWLVFADILEKRGFSYPPVTKRAIDILLSGADLARLTDLEMASADLVKRKKISEKLLERLQNPRPEKPRKTMKKPKPVAVELGDVVAYPVYTNLWSNCGTGPINPYYNEEVTVPANGWRAMHVADAGALYGFLPWIGVRRFSFKGDGCPNLENLPDDLPDKVYYGVLSPQAFKRMKMQIIGKRDVDLPLPELKIGESNGEACAHSDVSIANHLQD